ncbi:MAG: hypothetical protein ABMA25_07475 [Ilumatobacteraceae bacterium]
MAEPWIREHFGPEVTARPGFERELADDLSAAWRGAAAPSAAAPTSAAFTGAAEVSSDDVWAVTRPDEPTAAPVDERPHHVPLQRRPGGPPPAPAGARRGMWIGVALAVAAAAVAVVVVRQQSDDSTTPGSPGVTIPGGGTLPGGATVPGQTVAPGDSTGTGTDAGGTTVDEGTAAGTQFMSPACFETRPTTAIPTAIDPAVLETAADDSGTPTFRVTLPTPLEGASFAGTDVRVVPGGVLVKASLTLADGTSSDTMLSVVNTDGVVRWTRCFTNAYTIGPFGENGDGSITIWVARNTTDLARYVDLASGATSDLLTGYSGSTNSDGVPVGLTWSITGNVVSIWLPAAAAVGNHDVTLP